MKLKIRWWLCLFLAPVVSYSQEILSQPEAKLLAQFPFQLYSGGVVIIRGTLEGTKDTLQFILDTGSGGISLDSATCVQHNIPMQLTDTTIKGIGGIRKVSFVFDKTLHLPGLKVDHLNFHVNNYDVLSSVYGEKIDGIIGYSFFIRYIVKLDFDRMIMEVYSPGKISYPRSGAILHPILSFLPIQYMQVRDRRKINFNFFLDTGAGLCFLMSEDFARDSAVLLPKRKPLVTQAEGMGGRLQMRVTVIKELKIGPFHFHKVPVYLYEDVYNVTSYPVSGGLLGNELLRRFNMIINYPQREIHLKPNSHYSDPFDYSYSGLGIYYIDNRIMVEDVIKGSPADKAGFLQGDEVFSVGNNLSHNLQQYKNLLQNQNQRIKVIVIRKGELVELYLRTASIL